VTSATLATPAGHGFTSCNWLSAPDDTKAKALTRNLVRAFLLIHESAGVWRR
jgi:hypothetical protein